MATPAMPHWPIHLRAGGTSLLIDRADETGVPIIVYWGEDLGDPGRENLAAQARAAIPQPVTGSTDAAVRLTAMPMEADGWPGSPGLAGHRDGRDWSPRLILTEATATAGTARFTLGDEAAGLAVRLEYGLDQAGLLHARASVTNTGERPYLLDRLAVTLPLDPAASEILTTTGRHLRERQPQREPLTVGAHVRESRRGRPGFDATGLYCAGRPGFGFRDGRVWAIHLSWSGNGTIGAERLPGGLRALHAAELLSPGEITLGAGQEYSTPTVLAAWGDGLDAVAARFHRSLRARAGHPSSQRPVTLNTWEAVYFAQDLDALTQLADRAAAIGVERFVLDDGWFLGRRDDTSSLGDWVVDPQLWPDGLTPLIDHVKGLGLQFGLWVEPEMISPRSELARAHPEWILHTGTGLPPSARNQQVLDLSNPAAFTAIHGALDALLRRYPIDYLKWDHNRDLLQPGGADGRAATHDVVTALYRLLDRLRADHRGLEIESCASGGGRIDAGILERTDRVWTSDCIDPIERATIQRYTGLLVPGELMGAHIGADVAHSTGRATSLTMRAVIALLGHLGVEWDIRTLTPSEERELAGWIRLHKELRPLIRTGTTVNADLDDPALFLRGVVSPDRSEAAYSYAVLASTQAYPPESIRLPGLDDDAVYELEWLTGPDDGPGLGPLPWLDGDHRILGRQLRLGGVRPPVLNPGNAALIRVTAA